MLGFAQKRGVLMTVGQLFLIQSVASWFITLDLLLTRGCAGKLCPRGHVQPMKLFNVTELEKLN